MSTHPSKTTTHTLRTIQLILAATTIGTIASLIYDTHSANTALKYALLVGNLSIRGAHPPPLPPLPTDSPRPARSLHGCRDDSVQSRWRRGMFRTSRGLSRRGQQAKLTEDAEMYAVKLHAVECLDQTTMHAREELRRVGLLNGDCPTRELEYKCMGHDEGDGILRRKCRWAIAGAVVMFVEVVVVLVVILVGHLSGRGGVRK